MTLSLSLYWVIGKIVCMIVIQDIHIIGVRQITENISPKFISLNTVLTKTHHQLHK